MNIKVGESLYSAWPKPPINKPFISIGMNCQTMGWVGIKINDKEIIWLDQFDTVQDIIVKSCDGFAVSEASSFPRDKMIDWFDNEIVQSCSCNYYYDLLSMKRNSCG